MIIKLIDQHKQVSRKDVDELLLPVARGSQRETETYKDRSYAYKAQKRRLYRIRREKTMDTVQEFHFSQMI